MAKGKLYFQIAPGTYIPKHGSVLALVLAILMPEEQFEATYTKIRGVGRDKNSFGGMISRRRRFEEAMGWKNLTWDERFREFFRRTREWEKR